MGVRIQSAGVQVEAEPGRIRFNLSELVDAHGDAFMYRLLERALRVESIEAIAIDRSHGDVMIEYDLRFTRLDDALERIAESLRGDQPVGVPDLKRHIGLNGNSCALTRIVRVSHFAGDLDAGRPSESDLAGWLPGFIRSGRSISSSGLNPGRMRIALDGIIVPDAPAHEPPDGNAQVATGPARPGLRPRHFRPSARSRNAPLPTGLSKLAHFVAAGGCFLLAIVGVVTPGIPTIPFVLATSYFLVRSTPEVNERLRRSRLFGQIVRDWEDRGGMRRGAKVRAIVFMCVLVGFTVRTATSVPFLAMTAVMATVDLWVVLKLPTIPDAMEA